jgi:hypothetical protein
VKISISLEKGKVYIILMKKGGLGTVANFYIAGCRPDKDQISNSINTLQSFRPVLGQQFFPKISKETAKQAGLR